MELCAQCTGNGRWALIFGEQNQNCIVEVPDTDMHPGYNLQFVVNVAHFNVFLFFFQEYNV